MEFVRRYTRIPVPHIKMMFYNKRSLGFLIVMTEIQGTALFKAFRLMSVDSEREIFAQLKAYSAELSNAASGFPTSSHIGSLVGGPLSNVMFDPPPERVLDSTVEFFKYWKMRLEEGYARPEYFEKVDELIGNAVHAPIVFSHGDLNSTNILVRSVGEGRYEIAGIIDWECSGFYPDFWERVMVGRGRMTSEWMDAISNSWPSSSKELARFASYILSGALEFDY